MTNISRLCIALSLCALNGVAYSQQRDAAAHAQSAASASQVLVHFATDQNLERAISGLREIAQRDPSYDLAAFNLGRLYEANGNWPDAAQWYAKASDVSTNTLLKTQALASKTRVLHLASLEKSVDGKRAVAYSISVQHALSLHAAGLNKEAIAELDHAVSLDSGAWQAYAVAADILASQHACAASSQFSNQAAQRAPADVRKALERNAQNCR